MRGALRIHGALFEACMKESFQELLGMFLWIVKAVLVIAGFALAIALLAALDEFQRSSYAKISAPAASTWIVFIGLGVVLAVLSLAIRSAVRFLAALPGTWSLFGDTAASRLIGLGVVAVLLPRAVVGLITVPIQVLVQMFVDIPQGIGRLNPPADEQLIVSLDQIALKLLRLLGGTIGEIGRALFQLFERIPVYEVVLALALWVIVGQLLSPPAGAAAAGAQGTGPVRLISYFQKLDDPQRRYLWIALVFLAGIYLSIAAIVAIPWLQEDKAPQNLTRERLEKALLTLVPKVDEAEAAPVSAPPDPLVQLDAALQQFSKRLETQSADADAEARARERAMMIEDIRQSVNYTRLGRDGIHDRWRQLREQVRQRRGQVVNEALNAFEAEMLSPMSAQERAFFFRDIQRSVQNQVADMQRAVQECVRTVSEADKQVEAFAREASALLSAPDAGGGRYFTPRTGALGPLSALLATRGCSAVSLSPTQYAAPDPGATWGPFGVVAQWLLRTKSQALALITGMLGFGLLGAAIATFVRYPDTDTAGASSPAGDAATIIIRGLAAAIVVFLAAKGGLAIVSTSDAEPNAYVLFFTCLVGAVFSEGVWKWAKTKLDGFLSNDAGKTGSPRGGTSSGAPPAATGTVASPPAPANAPPSGKTT
jgi:hypothetical protein